MDAAGKENIMAIISVDVNIRDFDTNDIISELEDRLSNLNKTEKQQFESMIKKYRVEEVFQAKTKADEWEMEVITANLERFSLQQIEDFFEK